MFRLWCALIAIALLCVAAPMRAQNLTNLLSPKLLGWQKLTGETRNFSGLPDGIDGDRQNSYVWSAAFHGNYLYVGTMRNVIGLVMLQYGETDFPEYIPRPDDLRGRIFRMNLRTGKWEQFYLWEPENPTVQNDKPMVGPDTGYRKMLEFTAKRSGPVLYVGGAGIMMGQSRLLAIDAEHNQPKAIFQAPGFSIRAIAEHDRKLFWASEVNSQPKIWYSSDPLDDFEHGVSFKSIGVPDDWFPQGAEILDMVSWNNALYVFFFDHDFDDGGFWCAKLLKGRTDWQWDVIVGESNDAEYEKGMGRKENGGATAFVFKNKMYVGTLSNIMWRFLHGDPPQDGVIPATGTQLFRFDKNDVWERIMPPRRASDTLEEGLNGFANPLNLYLWQFAEHNGKLYAGTFDARTALQGSDMLDELPLWNPAGFDLYCTYDGNVWFPETLNGFGDQWNYGTRILLNNPKTNDLYLGTANPFYGCQVWRKRSLW